MQVDEAILSRATYFDRLDDVTEAMGSGDLLLFIDWPQRDVNVTGLVRLGRRTTQQIRATAPECSPATCA